MTPHSQNGSVRSDFQLVFVTERGSSMPKLKAAGSHAPRAEQLKPWEEELNERFEGICSGPAIQQIEFSTRLKGLPRKYRLEIKQSGTRGTPILRLTPLSTTSSLPPTCPEVPETRLSVSPQPPSPVAESTALPEFVSALRTMTAQIPWNATQRSAIESVLGELDELANRSSLQLSLILLAGYLQFMKDQQKGSERLLTYVTASFALDEMCCAMLDPSSVKKTAASWPLYNLNARKLLSLISKEGRK